jgi:hypothetical protein
MTNIRSIGASRSSDIGVFKVADKVAVAINFFFNPPKGDPLCLTTATCGATGHTLSRSWKRVSGLLLHGQIKRHAAHLVAMDGAIHFVSARL